MKKWTEGDIIKIIIIVLSIICMIFIFSYKANAQTYTSYNDLFEDSYTQRLINMGINEIENFYNKDYIIMRKGEYDYIMVVAKKEDRTTNNNTTTMNNTDIIRYHREQNGNYYYEWYIDKYKENSTTLNTNNYYISNIKHNKSINSKEYTEQKTQDNIKILIMFILGIALAIFLTKERSSY